MNLRVGDEEDSEAAALRVKKAGFADWYLAKTKAEGLTEKTAERANLQRDIIEHVTGNNALGIKRICPNCEGNLIA